VAQPRGIYTTPMKRGGFGYNRTTLSEVHSHKGVVRALSWQCKRWRVGVASTRPAAELHSAPQTGEYEYIADPGRGRRSAAPQGGDARAPFRPPQLVSGNSFASYAVRTHGGGLSTERSIMGLGLAARYTTCHTVLRDTIVLSGVRMIQRMPHLPHAGVQYPLDGPALLDAARMRRTDHAAFGCGAQHHPQGGPVQVGGRTDASIGPAFRPVFAGRTDAFGPEPEYIPCPCSPLTVRPFS